MTIEERIRAELDRTGEAVIYGDEIVSRERVVPCAPSALYPFGYWRRAEPVGSEVEIMDARDVLHVRLTPHGTGSN